MPYVCNLKKDEQLSILERIAHNLQGHVFAETVDDVMNNALKSKVDDLQLVLDMKPRTAFDYGCNTKHIISTIVSSAICDELDRTIESNIDLKMPHERFKFKNAIMQKILHQMDDPKECEEAHFCDECGRFMIEGYTLAGDELYCSDDCLHKNYTQLEYLAMFAGLDHTNEKVLEQVKCMTDEQINTLSEENGSECFWTNWEDY